MLQLEQQDLLILDELGDVAFTKAGAELLFDVVGRTYERQSLIVMTNLPFEHWVEVLGNQRLTRALLDRLTHRVRRPMARAIGSRRRSGGSGPAGPASRVARERHHDSSTVHRLHRPGGATPEPLVQFTAGLIGQGAQRKESRRD